MLSAACFSTRNPYSIFSLTPELKFPVVIERRSHPFPFRTRQLSSASPMILRGQLRGKVGRRRDKYEGPRATPAGLFLASIAPAKHGLIHSRVEVNQLPVRRVAEQRPDRLRLLGGRR